MKERPSKSKKPAGVANKESSRISLESFFEIQVREGKLKPWQLLEIQTFFLGDCRLSRKEDLKTYETALAKY